MTETDISKVLIEGEYATIMGVKYKRVEESKPQTLYDLIWEEVGKKVGYGIDCDEMTDRLVDIVAEWIPPSHDTNSYKWNECLKLMREKLR
jgi:hypothetical protein